MAEDPYNNPGLIHPSITYKLRSIQYKVMKNLMPSHYYQITHDGSSGTTIVLNLPRDFFPLFLGLRNSMQG